MSLSSLISTEVYGKQLHDFIDPLDSRYVAKLGNHKAAEFVTQEFKDMGLSVSHQDVSDPVIAQAYAKDALMLEYGSSSHPNVIAKIEGTDLSNEVVLLGAHYDSVNWENTRDDSPGVDDNGSGIALLLSVARILSQAKEKPRRSILFIAFAAEEEGLIGSTHFAKLFAPGGSGPNDYGELKNVLIADEVAWPGRGNDLRKAIFETSGHAQGTTSMVDTLAHLAYLKNSTSDSKGDGIGNGLDNFKVNYHGFGSDHMPFLDEGYPAVLLIEKDDVFHSDTWGHSKRDTFDHVDMSFGAAMSRLALRAVACLANPE